MSMTFYGADARLDLNLADPRTALADEIARFVLDVDRYRVAGLAGMVRAKIREGMDERGQAHLDADKIKRMEGAPEIVAERITPAEFADRVYRMGRA